MTKLYVYRRDPKKELPKDAITSAEEFQKRAFSSSHNKQTISQSKELELDKELEIRERAVEQLRSRLAMERRQAAEPSMTRQTVRGRQAEEERQKRIQNSRQQIASTKREFDNAGKDKSILSYLQSREDRTYGDDFVGRFRANYDLGRMSQDSAQEWNDYLGDQSEQSLARARAIDQIMEKFQRNNEETLSRDGLISRSLANYLPQAVDQFKAGTAGALAGAGAAVAVGSLLPVPEELVTVPTGMRAGYVGGIGKYSYDTMRGAAFKNLIDLGVDEETAAKAAKDEALISSMIEMADAGVDVATLGLGKLFTNVSKIGAKKVAKSAAKKGSEKAAESALRKTANVLRRYGLNIASEAAQEGSQEIISIGNERRVLAGENPTLGNLLQSSVGVVRNPKEGDWERIGENAVEGAKIAAMMGGATMAATGAVNSRLNKSQRNAQNRVVDTVIENTRMTARPDSEAYRAAENLSMKRQAGAEITQEEVSALITLNRRERMEVQNSPVTEETGPEAPRVRSGANTTERARQPVKTPFEERLESLGENGQKALRTVLGNTGEARNGIAMTATQFYEAGLAGIPMEKMNRVELAIPVTDDVKTAMYYAGQNDAAVSLAHEKELAQFATVRGKDAGFVRNELSDRVFTQEEQKLLNDLGRSTGRRYVVDETIYGGKANGSYENGVVHIAADAADPFMTVAVHETTHGFQETAPEEYRAFRDYAVSVVSAGQDSVSVIEQYRQRAADAGVSLTEEGAMDEIASDFAGDILRNEETLRRFVEEGTRPEHRNMVRKFFDAVKDFVRKVKRTFKSDTKKQNQAAMDRYGMTMAQLEKAMGLWEDTLKSAVKAADQARQEGRVSGKSQNKTNERYSLNTDFPKQLDAWLRTGRGKLPGSNRFLVGTTSNALKSIGISDYRIYWSTAKISKIMDKHPGMTPEVIKSVPNMLENPILVMQSQTIINRITLFGEALDANGKPVLVALDLSPQNKSGKIMDFAVIASAYGKDNAQQLIDNSDILYICPDKNRTNNWLGLLRLQLPSRLTNYGSIGSVTLVNQDVNGKISFGDGEEKTAMQMAMEKAQKDSEKKYSLKDSTGKTLTNQQAEYFKDSKVLDENGNLLVMYHGTNGPAFDVFGVERSGAYFFTSEKEMAESYTEGDGTVMPVYLNIENPLVIDADGQSGTEIRQFFNEGTDEEYLEVHDTEGWIRYAKQRGYDGVIFHDLYDYGDGRDGSAPGTVAAAFRKNQIKDTENEKPSESNNIRFSLKQPVEETKDLIAVHNMSEKDLWGALELGGLPMPSIAIVKTEHGHDKYGPISFVFTKNTIDPKIDRSNRVYGGDGYTPTAPDVNYPVDYEKVRLVERTVSDLSKQVADGIFDSGSVIRSLGIEDESSLSRQELAERLAGKDTVRAAYLAEHGKTLKAVRADKVFNRFGNETLQVFIDRIGAQELARINAEITLADGDLKPVREVEDEVRQVIRDTYEQQHRSFLDQKPEQKQARLDRFMENNVTIAAVDDFVKDAWEYYLDGGKTKDGVDRIATSDALREAVDDRDVQNWIEEKLDGVLGEPGIYNGQERFMPSGRRKSFAQLHYAYTLENIVRVMKKTQPDRGGQTWGVSATGLQAVAAPTYKSIAEIKADSGRLGAVEGEAYETQVKAVDEQIEEIVSRIRTTNKAHFNNEFDEQNMIASIMVDAVRGKKTIDAIMKTFAADGFKISTATAKKLQKVYQDAAALPTEYFEAKPQRAVGFDEVRAAIVPADIDETLRMRLENEEIEVIDYDPSKKGDRLRAVNSVEDVAFSLKGQSNILKENAALRHQNEYLKRQLKKSKVIRMDEKALGRLTREILQDYSSEHEPAKLMKSLRVLYETISNAEPEDLSWTDLKQEAVSIAKEVLNESSVLNADMYNQYVDLREYLKTTGITLSERERSDFPEWKEFRRRYSRRLKLVEDGRPVDQVYAQLADQYPEFFDAEEYVHPADQLMQIADVLDRLQVVEENPYSANMQEASEWLADDILERFFEVPQEKTYADKVEQRLTRQKIHYEDRVRRVLTRERERREKQRDQLKERYKARTDSSRERRGRSELKNKIKKHVAKLEKMLLRPTDNSHVPEALKNSVADFLHCIDLDTDRIRPKTKEKLSILRRAYEKIMDAESSEVYMEVDPDLLDNLDSIIDMVSGSTNVRLVDMTLEQLNTLYRATLAMERSVYGYNRTMADEKAVEISSLGERVMMENHTEKGYVGSTHASKQMAADLLNMDMLAPEDFMTELGPTMKRLYQSIRKGLDRKIEHTREAESYMKELLNGTKMDEWTGDKAKLQKFTLTSGDTIELTPAQIMSLYLLNRQDDAKLHIYKGGIKQAPVVVKEGKVAKARIKQSFERVKVKEEDVLGILSTLTDEQVRIAKGISRFFQEYTAQWGNEVSMKLYGYKKFGIENYFPIVSDSNYLNTVYGETNDQTLKNMGSTKSRIKGASNPIIVEDVFDVFARQSDAMANYNAFVLPLSDVQRVFNFKNEKGSVKQAVEKRFGKRATQYFAKMMTDINGGARYMGGSAFWNKVIGNWKAARVGLNLRVIIQQPSAYFRALAMIDAKYLLNPKDFKPVSLETIYQYAPIARWKNWGFFSMDVGPQMKDIFMDKKSWRESFMWPAQKADEITWKRIWNAVELETRDLNPELLRGSEEYYQAVGERFSEIIDRTQVVDSVLHRPQILRNPDTLTKMTVSFMSEPMKSYNLLRTSFREFKQNKTKAAAITVKYALTGYLTSVIFNAVITGLMDAMRGDDDDEYMVEKVWRMVTGQGDEKPDPKNFKERWLYNFMDNLANEPLSMIPYLKDIVSILQGYTVKRTDMQPIADIIAAGKRMGSDKFTWAYKIPQLLYKVADLYGIPASNLKREAATATKMIMNAVDYTKADYELSKIFYQISPNKSMYVDILYDAYRAGDAESFEYIKADLIDRGVEKSYIDNGIRRRAKKDGLTDADVAKKDILFWQAGLKPQYAESADDKEEEYSEDNLTGAQAIAYDRQYANTVQNVMTEMQRDPRYSGMSDETKEKLINSAIKYSENVALQDASGGLYDYEDEWIGLAENARSTLGLSPGEYILLKEEYGSQRLAADAIREAHAAGVDVETYLEFRSAIADIKADKKSNGKTISGSKKAKVIDVLNSMNLDEKTYWILYEAAGYKK